MPSRFSFGVPGGSVAEPFSLAYMKRVVIIPLIAMAVIGLLIAALYWLPEMRAAIRDRSRIQQAYELAVRPATEWVRAFHRQRGRLPTHTELNVSAKTNWPGYSVGIYDSPPN